LASAEPQGDVRTLVPEPGRLFVVGDPKQSIYRFRRADVETFHDVRRRFEESDRVTLTSSFRSTPAILDFVNAVGRRVMTGDVARPWEAGYSPLAPCDPSAPRGEKPIVLLPPEPEEGVTWNAEERARREAWSVANLLLDRFRGRFGDVAILVP